MTPWPIRFFRGIIASVLIVLLHQTNVVGQTETTQPPPTSEAANVEAPETLISMSEKRRLAIEAAFENLRHRKFGIRQVATQHLANAGISVLPELERRALGSDVDFQNNCIGIISAIGREEQSLDPAVAALERLSNDPTFDSAGKALEELSQLKKHQTNRAIRLLKESGVSVSQNNSRGQVYSINNLSQDEQCKHLKHFPYLSFLTINGNGLTDACIKSISKVPNLNTLYLNSTAISPKGIAEMKSFPNLAQLTLAGNISAAHIEALTHVPQLSSVQLYTPVGDEELIAAAKLKVSQLTFAKLKPSAKTAEIMQSVNASKLQLTFYSLKDSDLKWLSGSKTPSLIISISSSKALTDDGIRFLENANITRLSLSQTGITAEAMKHIGSLKKLQSLSITSSPIDDESLNYLSNLEDLTSLRLQDTNVTGDGMATLKEKLSRLRSMFPNPTPKKPGK
ncbi:MAG: hypothetical protein CBE00_10530 [Planctomycetaceae bacterium TMED240]|nr:hypothetical protein [Rhodopirellula sp.]OUX05450.1 MAG: hypothetical protein CBE00_10530 [Planctomycetaceae bacterium TMED240]